MSHDTDIISAGKSCVAVARAESGCFVLGGADYFRAVREAVLGAESSVRILGWDFHSKVRMLRGEEDGHPAELGDFLLDVLDGKPQLEIHVLIWNFSMIYAAEREWKTFFGWSGRKHPRLHFRTDDKLPLGASHHQKVVVVDGGIGFAGGMDLAAWRWDDNVHDGEDPRRTDPSGKTYGPYHDLQMALTGPAAEELGRIFAQRWERATGEKLEVPGADGKVPWPESLTADFEETEIGFARTCATYDEFPEVREVEELHLRIIGKAERYLYMENQYLSSHRIASALCDRLREEDGPEIVLVLPPNFGGWKEENTMGVLRDRLLGLIRDADEHGRLRALYPKVPGKDGVKVQVYVHAKLMIADGRVVKVGSSNLTNRSMRVDSELDLVIAEKEELGFATRLLHRLLAVHHGTDADAVAEVAKDESGLLGLVDSLRNDGGHSLEPLAVVELTHLQRELADSKLLDPEEQIDPSHWIRSNTEASQRGSVTKRLLVISSVILGLVALAFLFREGLGGLVDKEKAMSYFGTIRDSPWSPLILTAIFLVASIAGISLNVLLVAAALVLNPWIAFGAGLVGAHAGANIGFLMGRLWGRKLMRRFAPGRIKELSRRLGERGVVSVAFFRLLPIAPFPVVNIAAGSSHLGVKVFNLGSLLGMAPGMLGVVLLADVTQTAVRQPDPWNLGLFALVTAAFIGAVWFVRRALRRRGIVGEEE